MMELSEFDRKALGVCESLPNPFTCTELGEILFAPEDRHARSRQCYARPAGKVLKRLLQAGCVAQTTRPFGDGRIRGCFCVTSQAASHTTKVEAKRKPTLSDAAHTLYDHFGIARGPGMHPYIAGMGEGAEEIHVYLVREPRHHEQQIPSEWKGWPVKTRVTGRMVVG